MIEFFNTLLLPLGLDILGLSVGGGVATILGPIAKILILKCFPKTAPIFAKVSQGQKELLKVLNATSKALHKNEDLREWAKVSGLKIAAQLIKKEKNIDKQV